MDEQEFKMNLLLLGFVQQQFPNFYKKDYLHLYIEKYDSLDYQTEIHTFTEKCMISNSYQDTITYLIETLDN